MARILIAEDERDIRDLISFTLQLAGHQVFPTADGQEALDMAIQIIPDLILLDVRMPRMTGYETCQQLKAQSSLRHVPVVFVSAKGQEAEVRSGLEAGAADYIVKPFAPDQLILRVRDVLNSKGG